MSPVYFGELPQGTPSISPATASSLGVGYCTASDCVALNRARAAGIGANDQPTVTDIDTYILMVAGQMDAVMLTKGYSVPVNTASHPEVAGLLGWVNAQGAVALWEESSPAPNQQVLDRLKASFDNALKMLSEGNFALDIDMDTPRSQVRAPYITFHPTGDYYDPTLGGGYGDGISSCNRFGDRKNPYFVRNLKF